MNQNLIHRNTFKVLNNKRFSNRLSSLDVKFELNPRYANICYLLYSRHFINNTHFDRTDFIYKDDYFCLDDNFEKLHINMPSALFDISLININHNTIKYFLRNNIIKIISDDDPEYAKIALLY